MTDKSEAVTLIKRSINKGKRRYHYGHKLDEFKRVNHFAAVHLGYLKHTGQTEQFLQFVHSIEKDIPSE